METLEMPMTLPKKGFWGKLSRGQKVLLISLATLFYGLPVTVGAVMLQQRLRSKAYLPGVSAMGPAIRTIVLPAATARASYRAQIEGIDPIGPGEALELTLKNLPAGLLQGPCTTARAALGLPRSAITTPALTADGTKPSAIICAISGTPTRVGSYTVEATLKNTKTGFVERRTLSLTVVTAPPAGAPGATTTAPGTSAPGSTTAAPGTTTTETGTSGTTTAPGTTATPTPTTTAPGTTAPTAAVPTTTAAPTAASTPAPTPTSTPAPTPTSTPAPTPTATPYSPPSTPTPGPPYYY